MSNSEQELRVLLVTNSLTIGGGAEALVLNIFNGLRRRTGVKVKLLTLKMAARKTGYEIPEREGLLLKDPDFIDSDCYVSLSVLKKNKSDLRQLVALVNSFKPHVIHSHLFLSELVAHEEIFPGIKYFSHCHDNIPQLRNLSVKTFTQKHSFTNFFEKQHLVKRYLKCNNKFISISEDTRQYFLQVLPRALSKNIFSLDNAIVTSDYAKARSDRDISTIRIINVGRFTQLKNQQFLVDVTQALIKRGHQASTVMLGKGEEQERVKKKIADAGLNDVISMPGVQGNTAAYYAAANVYVHVCRHEPFGLVLLEAMASGLPVVSLDGRGNRKLIEQGYNGYMLNDEDPELFADAVEKVLQNKEVYKTMASNSITFAQNYDIEEYLNRLINLYRTA